MLNDIQNQIGALAPAAEGLTAGHAQYGSARMLEHAMAHPVDDEPTRLVALMLENACSQDRDRRRQAVSHTSAPGCCTVSRICCRRNGVMVGYAEEQ